MKLVTAFFMAWGNFIALPCPYKKWDNALKNYMLALLPAVGAVVGLLWALLLFILINSADFTMTLGFVIPAGIKAFVMMAYIYLISGFFHLDGFMDCCDAILSRRPLEDRQRILKDSRVGAFAVISVALLFIGAFAAMNSFFVDAQDFYLLFFLLPITSRAIAGQYVLLYKPIGHSQYKETFDGKEKAACLGINFVSAAFAVLLGVFVQYSIIGIDTDKLLGIAFVILAANLGGFLACLYARKQLGGMSGDIAGYTICISEFVGMMGIALL